MDDANNAAGRVGKLLSRRPWKKQASRESFGSAISTDEQPRGRSPHSRGLSSSSTKTSADNDGEEPQRRGSQSQPRTDWQRAPDDDDASPAPYSEANETES